jgi:hypothetical protein
VDSISLNLLTGKSSKDLSGMLEVLGAYSRNLTREESICAENKIIF